MTDDPPGGESPFGRDLPEGLPALLRAQARGGGPPWPEGPPRIEVRSASMRLPGILGLLLAIPLFFLFGLVAITLLVVGAVGMLIGPWLLRRMIRRMEAEVPAGDTTIELDRSSYAEGEWEPGPAQPRTEGRPQDRQDQDRVEISRSSSSRNRGSTSR